MCIEELTNTIEEKVKNMTSDEQVKLLQDANIIDNEGYFHPDFFTEETVKENRDRGISFI